MPLYTITNLTNTLVPLPIGGTLQKGERIVRKVPVEEMDTDALNSMMRKGLILVEVSEDPNTSDQIERTVVGLQGGTGAARFTFAPGHPDPGGDIFDDWVELMDALVLRNGRHEIVFDNTFAPCSIPASPSYPTGYDFGTAGAILKGLNMNATSVVCTIQDGVTLHGVAIVQDDLTLRSISLSPVITWPDPVYPLWNRFNLSRGGSLESVNAPFLDDAIGGQIAMDTGGLTNSGSPVIFCNNTSTNIFSIGLDQIRTNTLDGTLGGVIFFLTNASTFLDPVQPILTLLTSNSASAQFIRVSTTGFVFVTNTDVQGAIQQLDSQH